ncbi:DUF202 domain-containing protein [Filobacillus milosensis]|uniref:DUF202 domain-containing protein n=1 Tax=Filobacillus milosensis TaxID=94137 RepID=A0A4Y8IM43_9BACI|nr:DUF202 domain-containing protein [Filobacillus milosensis]TFB21078.1 DUF202 domain-containing protein [Filobacillus milosensis]
MKSTIESKYITQHLANERTYLAWIRTALAMIGIGFLIVNIHFSMSSTSDFSNQLAQWIGIFSVVLGLLIIVFATSSYLIKKKQINEQTFQSSNRVVWMVSILSIILSILFFLYFLVF